MLTDGIDHVALSTADLDGFIEFFVANFDATEDRRVVVDDTQTMSVVRIGPHTEFNVFGPPTPGTTPWTLERGRLDHFGVRAANLEAFEEIRRRLVDAGVTDGYVSDFGPTTACSFEARTGSREKS